MKKILYINLVILLAKLAKSEEILMLIIVQHVKIIYIMDYYKIIILIALGNARIIIIIMMRIILHIALVGMNARMNIKI